MWYLKYRFKHQDCIYTPKLHKLGLSVLFYHLGSYIKGKHVFTSSLQQIQGNEKNKIRYQNYLRKHPQIIKLEAHANMVLTLAKHKSSIKIYETIYDPALLFPTPLQVDKEGFEIVEVASWERKPLQDLIETFQKNKTSRHFEILKLVNCGMNEIYVLKLLPKLPPKQQQAMTLALKEGYYQFPRKINLDLLAKIAKVAKPTFRENLKMAEAKIMPYFAHF